MGIRHRELPKCVLYIYDQDFLAYFCYDESAPGSAVVKTVSEGHIHSSGFGDLAREAVRLRISALSVFGFENQCYPVSLLDCREKSDRLYMGTVSEGRELKQDLFYDQVRSSNKLIQSLTAPQSPWSIC